MFDRGKTRESVYLYTGVHTFTFAPKSRPIWLLLYQSRPISIFQLKQGIRADCQTVPPMAPTSTDSSSPA